MSLAAAQAMTAPMPAEQAAPVQQPTAALVAAPVPTQQAAVVAPPQQEQVQSPDLLTLVMAAHFWRKQEER